MGGGNAQKSATARKRNEEKKKKAGKGSQLAVNQAAQSIVCQVRTFAREMMMHKPTTAGSSDGTGQHRRQ